MEYAIIKSKNKTGYDAIKKGYANIMKTTNFIQRKILKTYYDFEIIDNGTSIIMKYIAKNSLVKQYVKTNDFKIELEKSLLENGANYPQDYDLEVS